ncbi:MAG: 3-hydroxyacyl-CoA dehydrogenase NAD-binding domain-containing protein [Pirellulaceae bacterium]
MSSKKRIANVLIIGAGWVGRQVAARMAHFGVNVCLTDSDAQIAHDAVTWVQQIDVETCEPKPTVANWRELVSAVEPLKQLDASHKIVAAADLALECVPEQLSLKKRVLRQISAVVPPDCIIASNSSYFVPSMLSQFVGGTQRFAHMHFHVPVLKRSVCDVVGCEQTDPTVLARLAELAERIAQPPILLRHEHPGYIFNWLLQSVLKGALELTAQDVVDPEQVDQSWMAVTGMPVGPFGMMDQIGLDVIEQVLSNSRWAGTSALSTERLLDVLRPQIAAGNLGVKTGAGFYRY